MRNEPLNQNDNTLPEDVNRNTDISGMYTDSQAATSSESLVASEMSVAKGAVTGEEGNEVNKEANPVVMGQSPDRERLSGNRTN
jgi:hypothetical protein